MVAVPPLSKDMSLMARNEDETRESGALGNPGKGDRDYESKEPPRRTRIPALGAPAGAAAIFVREWAFELPPVIVL